MESEVAAGAGHSRCTFLGIQSERVWRRLASRQGWKLQRGRPCRGRAIKSFISIVADWLSLVSQLFFPFPGQERGGPLILRSRGRGQSKQVNQPGKRFALGPRPGGRIASLNRLCFNLAR